MLDRAHTGDRRRAPRRCSTPPTGPTTSHDVVRPALDRGEVVISDRYVDSSLAYQGAGRTSRRRRPWLSRWATGGLEPDLIVLLDLDAGGRPGPGPRPGGADRLEAESLEFHERVRQAFLDLAAADPDRYLVLDAAQRPTRSPR